LERKKERKIERKIERKKEKRIIRMTKTIVFTMVMVKPN